MNLMERMNREIYGQRTVVCDTGSKFVKAAVVGGRQITVLNVVGRRGIDEIFVADVVPRVSAGVLRKSYPMRQGVIVNFDDMTRVWQRVFDLLGIAPSECALILTESVLGTYNQRHRMVSIMFETFNFRSLVVAVGPVLTMYGHYNRPNDATGLAVEIGDGIIQVVSVYNGSRIENGIQVGYLAGRDVTERLAQLLSQQTPRILQDNYRETVRQLKENYAYVAGDPRYEITEDDHCDHQLGHLVLGNEKFRCAEVLFSEGGDQSIHSLVHQAMQALPEGLLDVFRTIVLGGGAAQLKGLKSRLKSELSGFANDMRVVRSIGDKSIVEGGCRFANGPLFYECLTTREEYDTADERIPNGRNHVEWRRI